MSKNLPVSGTLPERARGIIEGYSLWKQLSAQANKVTTCFATEPGVQPTCCQIHQMLHSMLLRLHSQAAALEDLLIANQKIKRQQYLFGDNFANANTLIIIQREGAYSFKRFSVGWFQMLQDFFYPQ